MHVSAQMWEALKVSIVRLSPLSEGIGILSLLPSFCNLEPSAAARISALVSMKSHLLKDASLMSCLACSFFHLLLSILFQVYSCGFPPVYSRPTYSSLWEREGTLYYISAVIRPRVPVGPGRHTPLFSPISSQKMSVPCSFSRGDSSANVTVSSAPLFGAGAKAHSVFCRYVFCQ